MNIKIKIAAGVIAGLIAGTTLVGSAFALPRTGFGPGFTGYGMMRSFDTSRTYDVPTFAEMNSFMGRYVTAGGGFDFSGMRADVTSGKVTPPCLTSAGSIPTTRTGQSVPRRGRATFGAGTSNRGPIGYNMMGSNF